MGGRHRIGRPLVHDGYSQRHESRADIYVVAVAVAATSAALGFDVASGAVVADAATGAGLATGSLSSNQYPSCGL